jgi:hypothetical protein
MSATGDQERVTRRTRILRRMRRNPLRSRAQSVHEPFVALVLVVALVLPALGFLAARAEMSGAEAQQRALREASHPVSAVLRQDVYTTGITLRGSTVTKAEVSWTAPDGSTQAGLATVRSAGRAGDLTTIRLDQADRPATEPLTHDRLIGSAVCIGLLTTLGGGALLLALYAGERAAFMRMRTNAWSRDWARTAPSWTRSA